jgi:hypothetical protein
MNPRLLAFTKQFLRYSANSGVALGFKLAAMALLTPLMHPSIAYAVVHVLMTFVSYGLHARLSFASERSWRGFFRFLRAVIGIKLLDYLTFNIMFAYLEVKALLSVVLATAVIFVARFFVIRKALVGEPPAPSRAGHG